MKENKEPEKNDIIIDADLGDEELDNASGGGDWLNDMATAPFSSNDHCPFCGEEMAEHICWEPENAMEIVACDHGHLFRIHREFEGAYNPDGWK